MDSPAGLMPFDPFSALPGQASPTPEAFGRLHAELEIQAPTLELACHKRIRFGQKSESLAAAGQRDRFD